MRCNNELLCRQRDFGERVDFCGEIVTKVCLVVYL